MSRLIALCIFLAFPLANIYTQSEVSETIYVDRLFSDEDYVACGKNPKTFRVILGKITYESIKLETIEEKKEKAKYKFTYITSKYDHDGNLISTYQPDGIETIIKVTASKIHTKKKGYSIRIAYTNGAKATEEFEYDPEEGLFYVAGKCYKDYSAIIETVSQVEKNMNLERIAMMASHHKNIGMHLCQPGCALLRRNVFKSLNDQGIRISEL